MAEHAPRGLGPAGTKLWKAIDSEFVFSGAHERTLLERACRCADTIRRLEDALGDELVDGKGRTRAELVEARLQTQLLSKLLVALRVPERDEKGEYRVPQRRGSRGFYAVDGGVA